jgi:hypothetical protein
MQQPQNYQWPAPAVNRGPPQSPADPRVKDAIELSQFAISALNVSFPPFLIRVYFLTRFLSVAQ